MNKTLIALCLVTILVVGSFTLLPLVPAAHAAQASQSHSTVPEITGSCGNFIQPFAIWDSTGEHCFGVPGDNIVAFSNVNRMDTGQYSGWFVCFGTGCNGNNGATIHFSPHQTGTFSPVTITEICLDC